MSEEVIKEISSLLENILVFEKKFKEEILVKASNLNEVKLNELKNILLDVVRWQDAAMTKTLQEDPDFYNKIVGARKKVDQEIINLYKQKLNNEDNKKMEIILNKINSI